MIDQWTASRLLTVDKDPRTRAPTVQVAHEALIRAWPRLRQWIDDDREAIMTLGHLRQAVDDWAGAGRDRRERSTVGPASRTHSTTPMPGQVNSRSPAQDFLAASVEQRDREQREAADQAARQARDHRRLRIQFAVIAVALVLALAVGFVAVQQRGAAERESTVAVGRELAAASVANLEDDPERSVLLALAAVDETRSSDGTVLPEAEDALHQAVNASRILLDVPGVGGRGDWSPTGEYFVTEGPEDSGMIDLRDATTGRIRSLMAWRRHRHQQRGVQRRRIDARIGR